MDQLACEWGSAKFLIFSSNVFDPLIYYSHLLPLIASLVLGLFVFFSNRKQLLNQVFLVLSLSFVAWVYFDLILWASEVPSLIMYFWSIIVPIELLLYTSALYLLYVFLDKRDTSTTFKIILALLFVPLLALTHTSFNLIGFDYSNCDRAAIEGPLIQYLYAIEFLIIGWAVVKSFSNLLTTKDEQVRKQNLIFSLGVIIFLFVFSLGNLVISFGEYWQLEQYKLFGMPVFIAILTYLIVRFRTFNIKLIATQALVVALVILTGAQIFVVKSTLSRIVSLVTFTLAFGFGYFLVKSVKREVEQREEIQKLANSLAKVNSHLNVANERLQELDRQKTEFVSIASHQLRTPLTAIKGYSSMMLEGSYGKLTEKMKKPIENIFESSQRLVTIIEDFLNITRIELGRMKYDFTEVNFREVAEQVTKELTPNAERKGLKLSFSVEEGEYMVHADQGKITQVISNIIDNAIKYTPSGTIVVSVSDGDGKVRVQVTDSGVGIPKETLPKLFDKFVRADDAGKVNFSGTGLGLYVAKQMVEAHKGKIWAESAGKGKGTSLIVELPAKA